jgi:hypothetical protein
MKRTELEIITPHLPEYRATGDNYPSHEEDRTGDNFLPDTSGEGLTDLLDTSGVSF